MIYPVLAVYDVYCNDGIFCIVLYANTIKVQGGKDE